MRNIGAKCFAQGSQTFKEIIRISSASIGSFLGGECDFLLKSDVRESSKDLAKTLISLTAIVKTTNGGNSVSRKALTSSKQYCLACAVKTTLNNKGKCKQLNFPPLNRNFGQIEQQIEPNHFYIPQT